MTSLNSAFWWRVEGVSGRGLVYTHTHTPAEFPPLHINPAAVTKVYWNVTDKITNIMEQKNKFDMSLERKVVTKKKNKTK